MDQTIKGLIIDYGKVISNDQHEDIKNEMQSLCRLNPEVFNRLYFRYRDEYDRGDISAREYWNMILPNSANQSRFKTIDELVRLDNRSWSDVNQAVLDWALGFKKKGYKLALLSNMPFEFHEYIKERFDWLDKFDPLVLSYKLGVTKPNEEIFDYCLGKMGIKAEEALFIDDNPKNIFGASRIGLNTIHFNNLDQAIEELHNKYSL
ncbi:MAG: HAD family phosphatase [Spirochaetales bacterium]|nr:HAD family phosphatase [Spirochaetales bacterium]